MGKTKEKSLTPIQINKIVVKTPSLKRLGTQSGKAMLKYRDMTDSTAHREREWQVEKKTAETTSLSKY